MKRTINLYVQILKFYFLLNKKAEGGFRRLLTPLQLLSLIPLNKKKFDFQGSPLWFYITFKICTQITDKYHLYFLLLFPKFVFYHSLHCHVHNVHNAHNNNTTDIILYFILTAEYSYYSVPSPNNQ